MAHFMYIVPQMKINIGRLDFDAYMEWRSEKERKNKLETNFSPTQVDDKEILTQIQVDREIEKLSK